MFEDVITTLDSVIDALNSAKIAYALCGGLAVNLHGHVRATRDIDLLLPRGGGLTVTERAPLTPELVERRLSELQQLSRLGASLAEAELPPIDRQILERRSLRVVARAPGGCADSRDVRLHVLPPAADRQLGWMPDVWVEPSDGAVLGAGWSLLVAAFAGERRVDAVPRRCEATIVTRLLAARPACVEALPLLEQSDQRPRLWLCSSRDRARTRW